MKVCLSVLCTLAVSLCSIAQTIDSARQPGLRPGYLSLQRPSTHAMASFSGNPEWWQIVSTGPVLYKSHNLVLPPVEKEIIDLESLECTAEKKRDTLSLTRLWARDFTLDKKTNKVVTGKSGLPNYLSLTRMIEKITAIDENTVFTSGYEMFQEVDCTTDLQPPAKRQYAHTWRRSDGLWKLTAKINE